MHASYFLVTYFVELSLHFSEKCVTPSTRKAVVHSLRHIRHAAKIYDGHERPEIHEPRSEVTLLFGGGTCEDTTSWGMALANVVHRYSFVSAYTRKGTSYARRDYAKGLIARVTRPGTVANNWHAFKGVLARRITMGGEVVLHRTSQHQCMADSTNALSILCSN